jgi:hypothetical protein
MSCAEARLRAAADDFSTTITVVARRLQKFAAAHAARLGDEQH